MAPVAAPVLLTSSSLKLTPHYGHPPIVMTRRPDGCPEAITTAGNFCWDRGAEGDRSGEVQGIWFAHPSPRGEGWTRVLLLVRRADAEPDPGRRWRWEWDGDLDAPTLSPSVHTTGHWHGWVRGGKLVEA